jgi:RNA polymerase sigma-70 factor (ECF subfamily)
MEREDGEVAPEELMIQYQQAVPDAAAALIELLSPKLYGFFAAQMGSRAEADDMLQEVWLRIHRVRHTYRPGEPLLPWLYAIARRVRIDNYRKRRTASRELAMDMLPERPVHENQGSTLPPFDSLVAVLPASQREVLRLLKVDGLTVEEVARATSSTAGAVKQKAHRAYERLRTILQPEPRAGVR